MIRPRKALGIAGEKRQVFVAELRTLSAIADKIHAVQYRIIATAFWLYCVGRNAPSPNG